MITRKDLSKIYDWAKNTKFPLKKVPTAGEYSNKDIFICWLKGAGKKVLLRKKLMSDEILDIFSNQDIIYASYSYFDGGTILNPHRDPDVYPHRYKRIQLPLNIPSKNHCFMIWGDRKVTWREGVAQTYPVMDVTHEGYNLSTKSMEFVMIDVKLDAEVENETDSK
tara:strand:+ start:988 stop:1485 length:498 start_codon:yes stop_codon:yes gene_type:complete